MSVPTAINLAGWRQTEGVGGELMKNAPRIGVKIGVVILASTFALTAFGLPNLTPYQAPGWSDRIVVSRTSGTTTDSTSLAPADTLYVDWAVLNNGNTATATSFNSTLFVDGIGRQTWLISPPLGVNFYQPIYDYSIGSLSAGTHTITISVDYGSNVAESNEADNSYTKTISVSNPSQPNLVPGQPAGWSDKIVVSRTAGTTTDSASLTTADTLYVDWAVANIGPAATGSGFYNTLYVDGVVRTAPFYGASLPAGNNAAVSDYSIGSLSAGTHTITITVDSGFQIAESNEADNSYTKTISVSNPSQPNLVPGQPAGWSDKIVVSRTTGTTTDSASLTTADTLYVDWAVANIGTAATGSGFYDTLYVDGVVRTAPFYGASLPAGMTAAASDYSIGSLSAGTHSITITVDSGLQIAESSEGDNSYTKIISVGNSSGAAPVAAFSGDFQPVTGKIVTYNGGYSTGSGLAYAWAVSDGRTSSATAPQFVFNSPGTYTISLTVTDSLGRTSSAYATIYVQAANNGTTPGQPVGADPVVLSSGNYVQERVDLRMPGKGFPFEFKRFYNSKFGDQTGLPLGFGWTHAYNERIKDTGTNALVIRGDGSTLTFFQTGGSYTAEPGVYDSLVHNGDSTWSHTEKSQAVKRFDSAGRLTSITDKNSNALILSYNGGVLRQIQDTAGRTILLNTNGFGCISDITDPIGRTIAFQYDSNTNLVRVIDANSQISSNKYDNLHQLTDAYDPKGTRFVHNEYDTNSFVVLKQHDAFTNWTFFYFDTNRITYQTNVLGKVSVHVFDGNLLATNIVDEAGNAQSFAYDANRNRISARDKRGNSTTYGYDARGNVTNKTDALNHTTGIEYNTTNNPTKRIDALTQATRFAYNASGNLTQTTNALGQVSLVEYNAFGLPIILTDANNHKTTNTFDAQGNLTRVQDALGNTTTFGYDGAARKVAQTNANNKITRYFYDNNDNLLRVVDPLNRTNSYIYDANNNRIITIDARGAATTNTFDSKDRLISVRDAMAGITTYEYDALDRKTKVIDARNGVTRFGYDDVGNLVTATNALNQATRFTYDANGNQTTAINPLGQTTTNIFDTLNRLVMTIDPQGHTNRTVYDALGRRAQTIDALNRTNQFAYDLVGRLTQVTDANGGTSKVGYDNVGNRLVTTDPINHFTTNTFDALNRLVRIREPGGGVYQFAYDGVGNRTSQIDPKLQTNRYSYDGNNRRTGITYPTGSPVTFGYDPNGNRTTMADDLGTTTYQYDPLNRLVSVTDAFGKSVSCGYDPNGNRVSLTYPGSKIVTYGFDPLNRMVSVTNWLNGVTAYSYDPAGNLIHTTNPNATAVDYRYDAASRLISLTNSGPSSAVISSYAYTLDAVGNHSQVDQVEQLQTLPLVGSSEYTYDNDNRMITMDGSPQGFDANGNMVSINAGDTLSYDYENRLTQAAFVGNSTNIYQYDGAGNRLSANRSGLTTRYVLDRSTPLTQVLAETDSGGTIKAYFIYGLGLISRVDSDGNAQHYHFDSRGSTVALTDATGQITDAFAYDPFGRPKTFIDHTTDNRFRYLGRHGVVWEEGNFYYIRARYYSTKRGRFITKDPTTGNDSDGQSLNRYVYALNNPVRLIDISGLSPRESSHISIVFATSDSSRFHNFLISPSTAGLDTRTAGSTPQYQPGGFNFGDPAFGDQVIAFGELVQHVMDLERVQKALQFTWSQRGRLEFLGRIGLGINIAQNISEQLGSIHDVSSFASASQAVAANVLVDFTGVSSAFGVFGVDVHVTGDDLIRAERNAADTIAHTELNAIMWLGNQGGNLLYNAAPGLFR